MYFCGSFSVERRSPLRAVSETGPVDSLLFLDAFDDDVVEIDVGGHIKESKGEIG